MMKQITLAAITALFVVTGVGMASAESGVSSAVSDEGSSAWLQADFAAKHSMASNAYGYAIHRPHVAVARHRG